MTQNVEHLNKEWNIDLKIKTDYTVWDMIKKDIPEILALQEKVLGGDGFDPRWFYPFSEEELKEMVETAAGMTIGVFAEGELIAFRAGSFSGSEYDEITRILGNPYTDIPCFLMNGVFVDPAWRGNHLQQALTEQCIARCRERGIGTFLAAVHPDNIYSIKSLKNIGFEARTRQMIFNGKYDRLILVKESF